MATYDLPDGSTIHLGFKRGQEPWSQEEAEAFAKGLDRMMETQVKPLEALPPKAREQAEGMRGQN